MRILYVGDVFGRPGRNALKALLPGMTRHYQTDFCIVNGENAAHGKGITQDIASYIFSLGVDVITMGNHTWDNKDIYNFISHDSRIIRPHNYPKELPGRGFTTLQNQAGMQITVGQVNLRLFMNPIDCPFKGVDDILQKIMPEHPVLIDIHGEATSEKVALGWYLDGRVSAVVGTHTHVQTADERVLPKGTAYITDVGMTGAQDSVIGMDVSTTIDRFLLGSRVPYQIADSNVKLHAALIDIDDKTCKANSIERICVDVDGGALE